MSRYFDDYFHSSGRYLVEDTYHHDEIWEPLKEYPGYYICKEGYVVNQDGKILPEHKGDIHGHINVRLRVNHKQKEEYLHRLLAKQYIPNPKNLPIVRHLDDDPSNNDLSNLAWGTQRDNHFDCVSNGNYKPFTDEMREKSYSKSRTPVIATNLETGEELYFKGQRYAAKKLGVQHSNLYKVLVGKRKATCGYSFRYAEKGD